MDPLNPTLVQFSARLAADAVVVLHGAFILFAALGALLAMKFSWMAWLHLPAALWGATVSFAGWICPLTPLENFLRTASGQLAYSGGFIERYLIPLIYPAELTRTMQITLGAGVVMLNVAIYGWLLWRRRRAAP